MPVIMTCDPYDDGDDDEKTFGDLFDTNQPLQCPLETGATVPETEIDLDCISKTVFLDTNSKTVFLKMYF